MTTPFIEACRDAAGKYGPNACDLPHDVLGKLQALALMERHDWSDLCGTEKVERHRMGMLARVLETAGEARAVRIASAYYHAISDADVVSYNAEQALKEFADELLEVVDDLTYGEVLFELEEQHNRLTEPQDEIARDDAQARARDVKASA